jgi:sterol desaturase/sphingolipid hydroxylase (fatty acid hydroxylase superfamily)
VVGLVGGTLALALARRDRRRGLSAASMGLVNLLAYEWLHFLIHSRHRPRSAWFHKRWRAHRWHHYRNEGYGLGVLGTLPDRVLRTAPEQGEVPLSATARGLSPVTAARPRPAATVPGPPPGEPPGW